jgi:gluconolactonase
MCIEQGINGVTHIVVGTEDAPSTTVTRYDDRQDHDISRQDELENTASTFESIITFITNTMSNIIPVDLLSFATNPSYLNNLVATNLSIPENLQLLAYDPSFASVIGENATTRQLHNFADWEPFHKAGVYHKDTNKVYVTSNWAGDINNPINISTIDLGNNYSIASSRYPDIAEANGGTLYFPPGTQGTYGNGSTPSRVLIWDQGDFSDYGLMVS